MKTKSKALLLTLCAVLLVTASVLGTMAFLTSNDEVVNTFSVGSVAIKLDEAKANKEGCPLYVKPVSDASKHIDTCTEGCTGEDCKCPCHLFDRLMACQTLEEIEAIIKATPEDVLKSLSEEQVAQVEAYMDKLMPAPLPAIVIEESEPPVESEIYRPTVNYTNVAPFGEPVTGGN